MWQWHLLYNISQGFCNILSKMEWPWYATSICMNSIPKVCCYGITSYISRLMLYKPNFCMNVNTPWLHRPFTSNSTATMKLTISNVTVTSFRMCFLHENYLCTWLLSRYVISHNYTFTVWYLSYRIFMSIFVSIALVPAAPPSQVLLGLLPPEIPEGPQQRHSKLHRIWKTHYVTSINYSKKIAIKKKKTSINY